MAHASPLKPRPGATLRLRSGGGAGGVVLRVFAVLLALLLGLQAQAAIAPTSELAALRDPTGSLSIAEVSRMEPARFRPLPTGTLTSGFTRDTAWLRLTLKAPPGEWWLDVTPAVLDDLRLYEPDPARSGRWIERRAGDLLPFSTRELPYRGFVFRLNIRSAEPQVYYLRLQTSSSSLLVTRLLSPADFLATTTLETGLMLAGIVALLIVALLNLNNWLWLRDSVTPWFVAQMLSLAGYFSTSSGLAMQFLWPGSPGLNYAANTVFVFLMICTGNGMFRRLFGLDRHRQVFLFWLFEVSCWLPLLAMPLALIGWQVEVMPFFLIFSIVTNLVCCVVALRLWRRGTTGSGALLVACLLTFLGIFISIIQVMGLIPGGVFIWQSMQLSSLANILAIHVSLGARYRELSRARREAELQMRWEQELRVRQRDFLSMLTHELRNSLAVVGMSIGIQPMSSKAIATAQRAMSSLSAMIEHSVEAEKLSDGQIEPERVPCDVSQLVQSVIAECREPDRIRAQLASELWTETDGRLLRVIVSNLLDNALKYSSPNSPVDVQLNCHQDQLCLRVCNRVGKAGTPDPQRVFEKYYRAPQAQRITGSGLGLHITAEIAKLLGAKVLYQPGNGLVCFECRI